MKAKDQLGRRGEALAASYLEAAGVQIVDRNWRCPMGELDLVAIDGSTLIVIEVKTRSSSDFGDPLEGISAAKLHRLYALATQWAAAHELWFSDVRVDAVSVIDNGRDEPEIDYLEAVT